MLELIVTVTPARDRAAGLRIVDGLRTLVDDWAIATVDPAAALRADNPKADPLRPHGHPPLGRYELTARGDAPQGTETEYGRTLLLFEPVSGEALDAESFGRLGLLVYAGRMAPDSRLRRTQGGLRISSMAMDLLLGRIEEHTAVELRIEPFEPPPWWAFWRKPVTPPAYSERPPQFDTPPLDETTLMAELLLRSRHRVRAQRLERDDDEWERRRERDARRETQSSSGEPSEFRGRGGEGGGAGASGGWSDTPTPGRGPGVDAAGRIVTAAGVSAVAAAAVVAAREHSSSTRSEEGGGATDSYGASTSESASVPSSSSDAGGDSTWSETSTSY